VRKSVRLLVEHGSDVKSRDNQGRTPLHVILPWSDNLALPLLERGADPGARDDPGRTPLHSASEWRFARRLLELGADVNSRDNQGRTLGNTNLPLLLLERGADLGVRDDDGQTPLHAALRWGWCKFARRLLELGSDVNSQDNTPLHVIEWWGDDDAVPLLLLEGGADQVVRDNDGCTHYMRLHDGER